MSVCVKGSKPGCVSPPFAGLGRVAVLLLAVTLFAGGAHAQVSDPDFPATNGAVRAQLLVGDTLFLGGDFTSIGGTNAGGLAEIDPNTGALARTLPSVDGQLNAIEPDGQGGWYLGGLFRSVAGVPRQKLAHVRADGTLDDWNPGADGEVYALHAIGDTVYVGGRFTEVSGIGRLHLAALDATSGLALAWNPGANADVYSFAASATRLFVGGVFTTLGGQNRSCVGAFNLSSGAVANWNPSVNNVVRTMLVAHGRVYLGGDYTLVGGGVHAGLAAVDTTLGHLASWDPGLATGPGYVYALAADSNTVWVGGWFQTLGASSCSNLAAIDAVTAEVRAGVPEAEAAVRAFALNGATLYVGGDFFTLGGQVRLGLAAIDAGSFAIGTWNPSVNTVVPGPGGSLSLRAMAMSGSNVIAAGDFSGVGALPRARLAAIDIVTGSVLPWNPGAISTVSAFAARGGVLYVGGDFILLDGQVREHVAAFDLASGTMLPWQASFDGTVRALAASGASVYAGGAFANVNGVPRQNLAALDAGTGDLLPWDPGADGAVTCLAANDTSVFVGGWFSMVGAAPRASLACVDTAGAVRAWDPGTDGMLNAMTLAGDRLYVGGFLNTIAGQARKHAAAIDVTSGEAYAWDPRASSDVNALAVDGATAYLGGYFYALGDTARNGIAATDSATGAVLPWDPSANWQPFSSGTAYVYSMALRGTSVFAGGDYWSIGRMHRRNLSRLLDGTSFGEPVVSVLVPGGGEPLEIGTNALLEWTATGGTPRVQSVDLYLSRTGEAGPWTLLAAGAPNTGSWTWYVTGPPSAGEAYLRVDARDFDGRTASAIGAPFAIAGHLLAVEAGAMPPAFALLPPAPNPTRGVAALAYELPRATRVRLSVLDVQGRSVALLADGLRSPGRHVAHLDAGALPAGLYFVRLEAGGADLKRKVLIVR